MTKLVDAYFNLLKLLAVTCLVTMVVLVFGNVVLRYGFMESPNLPRELAGLQALGLVVDPMQASYFLGRETLVPTQHSKLGRLRRDWFISLSHSASATKIFFRIPPNRAIELGNQIQI